MVFFNIYDMDWQFVCANPYRRCSNIYLNMSIPLIAMKFCTYIHGPHRMNCNIFADPLTFDLALSLGQKFYCPILCFMTMCTCITNDTPISPSCTLCTKMVNMVIIIPAKHLHGSIVIVSFSMLQLAFSSEHCCP